MKQAGLMLQLEEMRAKIDKITAEAGRIDAETIRSIVTASYEALQGAQIVSTIPNVAPVADAILTGAGYKDVNGSAPNIPDPAGQLPEMTPQSKHGDYVGGMPNEMNPNLPELQQADGAQAGIETLRNDGTQPGAEP